MTKDTYNLIKDNYTELFTNYCKFSDKHKISNSCSCEDNFNNKILYFLELEIQEPTVDILKSFLKTKRKEIKYIRCIEYKDYYPTELSEEDVIADKLKYLFIDNRKNN